MCNSRIMPVPGDQLHNFISIQRRAHTQTSTDAITLKICRNELRAALNNNNAVGLVYISDPRWLFCCAPASSCTSAC